MPERDRLRDAVIEAARAYSARRVPIRQVTGAAPRVRPYSDLPLSQLKTALAALDACPDDGPSGFRAGVEAALKIIGERAQELAVIRHPTERQMGAFDAVSALEDEVISCTSNRVTACPDDSDGGWRTIDTAPKDGTPIDLWCQNAKFGGHRSADMSWQRGAWGKGGPFYELLNPGWQPTHWRPLPPPPRQA